MTVRILLDTLGRTYISRAKSPPCRQCGGPIKRRGTAVKYCSRFCFFRSKLGAFANRQSPPRRRTAFACGTCGKECSRKPSALKPSRRSFCSRRCASVYIVEKSRRRGAASPTAIERMLYECLTVHGIEFDRQRRIGRFVADAYVPSTQTVIEVDGEYWHSLPKNQERDARKNAAMSALGLRVVRISEREARADIRGALVRGGVCR